MSPRFIGADELPEIMAAIEMALLADDREELYVDLVVPVAVARVAMRPRCWWRRELVAHLLAACAPWTATQ